MAGGPIFPNSVYLGASSGNLFPNFYAGGGGNISAHDEGIGVVASLSTAIGTCAAELRFVMPPSIPTGTLKLRTLWLANASAGNATFSVLDAVVTSTASPSAVALTTETAQTVSFTTPDIYVENKVTLTASPSAGNILVAAVRMNSTGGWTLAAVGTFIPMIVWE